MHFVIWEKLAELNLMEPQIVLFKNALIEGGFPVKREDRTLAEIVKRAAKEVRR